MCWGGGEGEYVGGGGGLVSAFGRGRRSVVRGEEKENLKNIF